MLIANEKTEIVGHMNIAFAPGCRLLNLAMIEAPDHPDGIFDTRNFTSTACVLRLETASAKYEIDDFASQKARHDPAYMTAPGINPLWLNDPSHKVTTYRDEWRHRTIVEHTVDLAVASVEDLEKIFDMDDFLPV